MRVMNSAVVTSINGHAVSIEPDADSFCISVDDMIELRNSVNILEEIVKGKYPVHHGAVDMPVSISKALSTHMEKVSAILKRVEDGVMLDEL